MIPNKNAVNVLANAISMPSCVAVRKKTLGFISGEEITKAITALKGIPAGIKDNPIGIAA